MEGLHHPPAVLLPVGARIVGPEGGVAQPLDVTDEPVQRVDRLGGLAGAVRGTRPVVERAAEVAHQAGAGLARRAVVGIGQPQVAGGVAQLVPDRLGPRGEPVLAPAAAYGTGGQDQRDQCQRSEQDAQQGAPREAGGDGAGLVVGLGVELVGGRGGLAVAVGQLVLGAPAGAAGLGLLEVDGLAGVGGHRAGAGRRGGLEAHPAGAGDEELGPGVQVVGGVLVDALGDALGPQEADGHAGGDAELARHHGHRAGELLAVAGAGVVAVGAQELLELVGAVARRHVAQRVVELLAEPVLEGHGLLEPRRCAGGDLVGQLADQRRHVGGQVGVGGRDHADRGGGVGQLLGGEVEVDRGHRPGGPGEVEVGVAGQEVHRRLVVAPVARGLDPAHRGEGRQPARGERLVGLEPVVEGAARHRLADAGQGGHVAVGPVLERDLPVARAPLVLGEAVEHRDAQVLGLHLVGAHGQQRGVVGPVEVAHQVGHRVVDADLGVPAGAPTHVEELHVKRRHRQRHHHGQRGRHPAHRERVEPHGGGVHAQARGGRERVGAVLAQAAAPARDLLALLQVEHGDEAERGEREDPPGQVGGQQADRHAVDREQRQAGQRHPPQPAGQ